VLLSPNVPLLFMGEEYGETAPFHYFIEHGDPALVEAVRQGRKREFAHFGWRPEDIPDPQDLATFERSRLSLEKLSDRQAALLRWTNALIRLRKNVLSLGAGNAATLHHRVWAFEAEQVLVVHRWEQEGSQAMLVLGFNKSPVTVTLREPQGTWRLRADSMAIEFGGTGQDAMLRQLVVSSQGASVTIPAYTATLFIST